MIYYGHPLHKILSNKSSHMFDMRKTFYLCVNLIGLWIVADLENLPTLNNLYIYGTLEFEFALKPGTEEYYNFVLSATNIFIGKTGRFVFQLYTSYVQLHLHFHNLLT